MLLPSAPWKKRQSSYLTTFPHQCNSRCSVFDMHCMMQITYAPLSVMITTFRKENVKRPLEGFGVLVPSEEQKNGLRTLGNASLWQDIWIMHTCLLYTRNNCVSFLRQEHSFPPWCFQTVHLVTCTYTQPLLGEVETESLQNLPSRSWWDAWML